MATHDMRGLEKVFKRLCHYAAKSKHLHALEAKAARQAKLSVALKRPEQNKMIDKTGKPMTVVEVEEELSVVTAAIATYTAKIRKIESKGCNKISVKDIMELLKDLGNPMSKEAVREMIWEVDEDLDECVSWDEFSTCYQRSVHDKSGLEPSALYNVAQFMLYDKNFNGKVSMDETMMMLYQRFGKMRLEQELQKLFGSELNADGELTFSEYLKATEVQLVVPEKKSKTHRPVSRAAGPTSTKRSGKKDSFNSSKGPRAKGSGRRR